MQQTAALSHISPLARRPSHTCLHPSILDRAVGNTTGRASTALGAWPWKKKSEPEKKLVKPMKEPESENKLDKVLASLANIGTVGTVVAGVVGAVVVGSSLYVKTEVIKELDLDNKLQMMATRMDDKLDGVVSSAYTSAFTVVGLTLVLAILLVVASYYNTKAPP